MSTTPPVSPLRELLEDGLSKLSHEVDTLFAESRDRARREYADQLNQAVRRLRLSPDPEELCATLADAAAAFSAGAALFRISGETARGERIRGVPEDAEDAFRALAIPLYSAPALAGAVQSRDPVISVSTPSEVSFQVARLIGHSADGRVAIFPVVVNDGVAALVYAWGSVQTSTIELLALAAGAVWSAMPLPVAPDLVTIAPLPAPTTAPKQESLPAVLPAMRDPLPLEEEPIHLRAQRFALVKVAEMRLFEADAVQAGRTRRNLYEQLRKPIDAARATFQREFLAPCASMIDYLHLELTRTLANDDAELLGNAYPGPLA
jgi:hypothetical protein